MTTIGSKTRGAIGKALTNDPAAIVDAKDARKIVETALQEIKEAEDPRKAFDKTLPAVLTARKFLGETNAGTAARVLSSFEKRGKSAVDVRLQQLAGGATQLPTAATDAFKQMMKDQALASGNVTLKEVTGSARDGYAFSYTAGGKTREAHALKAGDEWFFSPQKVTKEDLQTVTRAFQKYFDEEWAPELRDNGSTAAEVRRMRTEFTPQRTMFPGESDPSNYAADWPLVFSLNNPTGSDHGCYVAFNPADKTTECYTFN
ncbi:MAG: hypothetical protein HY904_03205 [Deltaproteobacteria bacterium]|nr:hypothetical protein [Deltaproteobacteria bacterium]